MNYLTSDELDSLRNDICPDCVRINLDAGRAAVPLRTSFAGTRFNVWLPRMIADGERLDAVGK